MFGGNYFGGWIASNYALRKLPDNIDGRGKPVLLSKFNGEFVNGAHGESGVTGIIPFSQVQSRFSILPFFFEYRTP